MLRGIQSAAGPARNPSSPMLRRPQAAACARMHSSRMLSSNGLQ